MNPDPEFISAKISHLEICCRDHSVPLTVQRRTIMETLAGRKDHPTADQIYDAVVPRLPGISRTTVYRVLDTFVALGVSQRINSPEAKAHFDADTSRHHHVHCTGCGAVADLHDARLNALPFPAETVSGFKLVDYSISFRGICPTCRSHN